MLSFSGQIPGVQKLLGVSMCGKNPSHIFTQIGIRSRYPNEIILLLTAVYNIVTVLYICREKIHHCHLVLDEWESHLYNVFQFGVV